MVANSQGLTIRPGTSSLKEALNTRDDIFYDFVDSLLQWDPEDRPDPVTALKHNFLKEQ